MITSGLNKKVFGFNSKLNPTPPKNQNSRWDAVPIAK